MFHISTLIIYRRMTDILMFITHVQKMGNHGKWLFQSIIGIITDILNNPHYICIINSMYWYTVLQFNIITGQFPDTFSVESAQFRPMIFNKSTAIQICSEAGVVRTISCMNVSYLITWQWPEFSTTSHRSSIVHDTRRFPTKKPNPILTGWRYSRKDHFVSKLMGFPNFNTGDSICNSKPFILTFLWISRKIYS
jgi:hypothetical protein